jgi:succinoglycan biosynthesis protein ExoO
MSTRNTNQVRVSIIMPAYNAETTISQAIESCIAQSESSWELIIIDDFSEDGTTQAAKRYKDKRIIVEHAPMMTSGPGNARNHGLVRASGEWLTFLDADDTYHPQRIESLLRASADLPSLSLFYDNIIRSRHQPPHFNGPASSKLPDAVEVSKYRLVDRPIIMQPFVARQAVASSKALFTPNCRMGEDLAFSVVVMAHPGVRVGHLPAVMYWSRARADSLTEIPAADSFQDLERLLRGLTADPAVAVAFRRQLNAKLVQLPIDRTVTGALQDLRARRISCAASRLARDPQAIPTFLGRLYAIVRNKLTHWPRDHLSGLKHR